MRRLFAALLAVAGLSVAAVPALAAEGKAQQPTQSVAPSEHGYGGGGGCYEQQAQSKKPTA